MTKGTSFDDIKKAVDQLLQINSTVKRKKKAHIDKQKDLFAGILLNIQATQIRSHLTQTELKIDLTSYDEMFLQVIDSLILLHFGKEGYEVISFYLYDKFNPDGSINDLYDENDNVVPSETPDDIWAILVNLKNNPDVK
jgi:hypothetical protein